MNTADRIINALGNVAVADLPRLLVAVLDNATEEQALEAIRATHPTLIETGDE